MQPARFLFGRFAGDRNLVHRSAPNRIPPCFYPSPILVPGTTRSFFLQNFFHSGRVFRLTEIPSYYLEGVTICVATEKKGRKKNSSLPVFPPFSIFDDRDLVRRWWNSRWNQLGCCSRRVDELKSDLSRAPTRVSPFPSCIADFYASLRERSSSSSRRNLSPPLTDSLHPLRNRDPKIDFDPTRALEKGKKRFVKIGRRRRRRKVRWKVCGLINRRVVACSHERTNERPNRVCKVDIGSRIKHRWQTVPLMRRILEPNRTLLRPFPSNFWIRALNIYRPSLLPNSSAVTFSFSFSLPPSLSLFLLASMKTLTHRQHPRFCILIKQNSLPAFVRLKPI